MNNTAYPQWPCRDLFQSLHLQWLDSYRFSDAQIQSQLIDCTHRYFPETSFYQRALWYGAFYRREILRPKLADFYLQWIDKQLGFGLFAARDLPKGSAIGAYLGLVRSRSHWHSSDINAYCFSFPLQRTLYKQWFYGAWTLDALHSGNHTRFINHSYQPNCEAVPAFLKPHLYIFIHTKEAIAKGEQIVYHYGDSYWKSRSDRVEPSTFLSC